MNLGFVVASYRENNTHGIERVMSEEHKHFQEEKDNLQAPSAENSPAADADVQKELQTLREKAEGYYDAWLRAKAEMENMRRRLELEMENTRKFAIERFASDLLAVKDSLEAALAAENQTVQGFREGVEITLKQLLGVFQHFGVQELFPMGEKFDPNVHQAIGVHPTAEKEANTVHHVLQKGYLLNERLLRPALVMVTAPAPKGDSEESPPSP
jgi:molecular chaperone GrpE